MLLVGYEALMCYMLQVMMLCACVGMTLCVTVHVSAGSDPRAAAPAGSGPAEDGHDHPAPGGWGTNKKRGGRT